MSEIDGVILTYSLTDAALFIFEVKAAFVYISDQGNCLGEIYMDRFVLRDLLVELIGVLDRAIFYAGSTTRAYALVNVSGLLNQRYIEVPCFRYYLVKFGIGQDLDVGVPVDLDQLR